MEKKLPSLKKLPSFSSMSDSRRLVVKLLSHSYFNTLMGIVICSNLVVMALDANFSASCNSPGCVNGTLLAINWLFIFAYTTEAALRLYVHRWSYFTVPLYIMDAIVVVVGWADLLLLAAMNGMDVPSLNALRLFRVLRLGRAIRLAKVFPELYTMMQGFQSAMWAMWWGFVMIFCLVFVFSILAVELVLPIQRDGGADAEYCDEAFASVFNSVLFFFQTLVAGDSWGLCAVPLIKLAPITCGILFFAALISIQLGFTNLILAAIVETAAAARDADVERQAQFKEKEARETAQKLKDMVNLMDVDGNGTLSVEELLDGYDNIPEVSHMLTALDISRDDLLAMFAFMDQDHSGDLDQDEFIRCIQRAQTQDFRCQMMLMRLQVARIIDGLAETTNALNNLAGAPKAKLRQTIQSVDRDRRRRTRPKKPTVRCAGNDHGADDDNGDGDDRIVFRPSSDDKGDGDDRVVFRPTVGAFMSGATGELPDITMKRSDSHEFEGARLTTTTVARLSHSTDQSNDSLQRIMSEDAESRMDAIPEEGISPFRHRFAQAAHDAEMVHSSELKGLAFSSPRRMPGHVEEISGHSRLPSQPDDCGPVTLLSILQANVDSARPIGEPGERHAGSPKLCSQPSSCQCQFSPMSAQVQMHAVGKRPVSLWAQRVPDVVQTL